MAVTFPAHAALVVPLHRLSRGWLPLVPLIVGSCTPDLAYSLGMPGEHSHRLIGVALFCVPVGLLLWMWLERLVLPALRDASPAAGRWELGRFFVTRGLPVSPRGWILGLLAIAVGAASHVLWDGFTHRDQWPARLLYPDTILLHLGDRPLFLANALQWLSSLVGSLVFLTWAALQYRKLPPTLPGSWLALGLLCMSAVVGVAVALFISRREFIGAGMGWALWLGLWRALPGAFFGLTVGCLLFRLSRARGAQQA